MLNDLHKYSKRMIHQNASVLINADIVGFGNNGFYTIQFSNGNRATNVQGPSGLAIGQTVALSKLPGANNTYIILNKTFRRTGTTLEVPV